MLTLHACTNVPLSSAGTLTLFYHPLLFKLKIYEGNSSKSFEEFYSTKLNPQMTHLITLKNKISSFFQFLVPQRPFFMYWTNTWLYDSMFHRHNYIVVSPEVTFPIDGDSMYRQSPIFSLVTKSIF